ncbi:MAG: AraC family transcriptional regulator [Brevundimonas sp.]|nr:AraC family transcriptional regulator [Brevundimonas sp.]
MSVSVILEASSGRQLVLSHYAPGEQCRPHRHDRAQLSLLLAGGYVEDSEAGRARADGPSLSRKPGGFEHQNRFGDAGALILSLNIEAAPAPDRYFVAPRPAGVAGPAGLRRMADGGTEVAALMESVPTGMLTPAPAPQPWLSAAHDRLLTEAGLSIAALARSFGLHPVRFARLFRETFAQSPTAARQNLRAARAVGRLIRTATPLAEVAAAEGFADQAHLSRAISQTTGWSPGRLRRLFAGR